MSAPLRREHLVTALAALIAAGGGGVLAALSDRAEVGAQLQAGSSTGSERAEPAPVPACRLEEGPPMSSPPPALAPSSASAVTVEVRVLAEEGPRPDVRIRLYARGDRSPTTGEVTWTAAGLASTDSEGRARIPASPGSYLVAARLDGFAPALRELELPRGEPLARLELTLERGVSLFGRTVVRSSGEAAPLVELSALPTGIAPPGEEVASTVSDALGRFRLDGLSPGAHRLHARAVGLSPVELAPIELPRQGELLIELDGAATIEGFVLEEDGSPAPGARVALSSADREVVVTTGLGGGFAAEVAPGPHRLSARRGQAAAALATPVLAGPGETARGLTLRLASGATLEGLVVSGTPPVPVPGASILVSPAGLTGDSGAYHTGPDGSFRVVSLAAGSYDVVASAPAYSSTRLHGIALNAGEPRELTIVLLRTGAVAGRVTSDGERPVAGALVRASSPADDALRGSTRTGVDGRFSLEALGVGVTRIEARSPEGNRFARRTVKVSEGSTAPADFILRDSARVEGRVLAPRGEVEVSLLPTRAMASFDRVAVAVAPDGSFRSGPLEAGTYRVAAHRPGASALVFKSRTFVTAEPGQTAWTEPTFIVGEGRYAHGDGAEPGTVGAAFEAGPGGVAVSWVLPTGPAARAGIRSGDLLVAIDGAPVGSSLDAYQRSRGAPGSPVAFLVRREGRDRKIEALREE